MTDSQATLMSIIFGVAVFAVIIVVGWRSVQNRRIVRMQGANGQETIIVASEDDDITSVVTTTEATPPVPAPVANTDAAVTSEAPEFGRSTAKGETAI